MSYEVKQGNIFGRIGSGFGQGLAEQVPKEMEHQRLRHGLQELEQAAPGLNPMQFLTRAYGTYGLTPQMVQSLGEAAKHQGIRDAFQGKGNEEIGQNVAPSKEVPAGQNFRNIPFAGIPQATPQARTGSTGQEINQPGQPSINETNPANPSAVPLPQWTPAQRDADIANEVRKFPGMPMEQILQRSADNEARALAQPEAVRKQEEHFEKQREKAFDELDRQLNTKLQKEGPEIYKDISGQNKIRLQRLIERDLRENPNASLTDVVNKRTDEMVQYARSKKDLNEEAKRDFVDKIFKGHETYEGLKQHAKIAKKTGNSQEFYDFLRNKESGLGMSNQASASIAFEPSKGIQSYINKINASRPGDSRKYAIQIEPLLQDDDSILSVMKHLKAKDPFFNESEFLAQIREDQDEIGLNPMQQGELAQKPSDFFPDWGDIWILPKNKGYRSMKFTGGM